MRNASRYIILLFAITFVRDGIAEQQCEISADGTETCGGDPVIQSDARKRMKEDPDYDPFSDPVYRETARRNGVIFDPVEKAALKEKLKGQKLYGAGPGM
mmetsp:Transcript_44952/g.52675  ORF Transcript_44952/g.52675 Transcript_44952/m.52675 type:complete len:100 (-) Transcript_44952:638-937(-)|eukprot:CAMPEP_0194353614 /NCGR_PEP_ID=MMETSP0174-20130528/1922_1 /TAXON_ID=216777 /ORGANISM="Proboscia alata, Strain PI-D3" /LENGTH=99 /DNA_ID=CAMNT_0039122249 /DNA_START=83 /DNA_END=382 /DNA_ORIENTATION=+